MDWFSLAAAASHVAMTASALGIVQSGAGMAAVRRFAARPPAATSLRPPVTLLKPLHGDEPLLEQALATFCAQDYPVFQIVFGLAHGSDPATATVARLRLRFPAIDMVLVVSDLQHGTNRKVSNLMNMLAAARHDVLVIADSDLHVEPDYLDRVMASLAVPGTGLVTTLSVGLPAVRRLPEVLGASQITYDFLPGVLLGRALGRQDCLGVTMALRRGTLEAAGGFQALADHVADDAMLGRQVRRQGLSVGLAATLPATTVADHTLGAGFQHELRWARTIRAQAPLGYPASVIQFPIVWASLAVLLSGASHAAVATVALAWAVRALAARHLDMALRPMAPSRRAALRAPFFLLPFREFMSVAVMLASYRTRRVMWRGHTMVARRLPTTGVPGFSGPLAVRGTGRARLP